MLLQVLLGYAPVVTVSLLQHPRINPVIGLNTVKMRRFFESTLYIDVPYHNTMHATQVVWAVHTSCIL
jgi:hypothetical protein